MRAPALCLLIAVGASGISVVEDAVNSKKVPAQVSFSEVSQRQTSKHPLRAPAALLSPHSPCCVLTSHSTTVTHPAPFSLPWAFQDEFKALLDRRSLAEHASRRRLRDGFGFCTGSRFCADQGTDIDACNFLDNFVTQCKWFDMTIPAVVVVGCIVCCIVGCCVCCCRRRERRNREMSIPLNVTVMQPGMMQPGMMQPGMVQMPYQQMSGKA